MSQDIHVSLFAPSDHIQVEIDERLLHVAELAPTIIRVDIHNTNLVAGGSTPLAHSHTPVSKTLAYNADGDLISVTGVGVNKVLAYDANDRLSTVTDSVNGWTKTLGYDADDNLVSVTV